MQSFRLEVKNEKASSWVTQKSNSVRTRVSLSHLCRLKDFFFFELLIDSFFFLSTLCSLSTYQVGCEPEALHTLHTSCTHMAPIPVCDGSLLFFS